VGERPRLYYCIRFDAAEFAATILPEARMFGIGPEKIILLLVVVLLLFGAKRIPEIGSSFGKGIREFKKHIGDSGDDATSARADLREPARDAQPPAHDANVDAEREPRRLNS
jgi:sec-independent protein translocase protein TatA